jgi:CubicO group peptidase (beta-lactamase class C family)
LTRLPFLFLSNIITVMRKALSILALSLLPLISGCAQSKPDYWPTDGWKRAVPETVGVDSGKLHASLESRDFDALGIHSIVVIRDGYIVAEAYRYPYSRETRHLIYSCTKSFTSALIGIALDEGLISGVDQKVLPFFPDNSSGKKDKRKEAMTLKDLLTMQSGLNWSEINLSYMDPGNSVNLMSASPDWIGYVLSTPMLVSPGRTFDYNSGASHLLAGILDKATGGKTEDFAREKLLTPMGITDYHWMKDPWGIPTGGWGLAMKTEDLAKLGYLYLNGGEWDGRQLVSRRWVGESVKRHTGSDMVFNRGYGYGYQWWIMGKNIYSAQGYGGQYVFVIPDKNMVIAVTGNIDYRQVTEIYRLLMTDIPAAAVSDKPLPANPEKAEALISWQTRLAEPERKPPVTIPEPIRGITGKPIRFDRNPWGFISMTLTAIRGDELDWVLVYDFDGTGAQNLVVTSGLDNCYRISQCDVPFYNDYFTDKRTPVLSRVKGSTANALSIESGYRGITMTHWTDTLEVQGKTVVLKRVLLYNSGSVTVKGHLDED